MRKLIVFMLEFKIYRFSFYIFIVFRFLIINQILHKLRAKHISPSKIINPKFPTHI